MTTRRRPRKDSRKASETCLEGCSLTLRRDGPKSSAEVVLRDPDGRPLLIFRAGSEDAHRNTYSLDLTNPFRELLRTV